MPVDLEPMEWTRINVVANRWYPELLFRNRWIGRGYMSSRINGSSRNIRLEIDGLEEDMLRLGSMIVEMCESGHGMDKS